MPDTGEGDSTGIPYKGIPAQVSNALNVGD